MATDIESSVSLGCLFWNVNRRDRRELIGELALEKNIDIVILAEHDVPNDEILDSLRRHVADTFIEPQSQTPRVQLFTRNPDFNLEEIYGDASGRVSIRHLRYERTTFLLAIAHLRSKLHSQPTEQASRAQIVGDQIRREEGRSGHRRTILVGDLNMNPFEDGVVQATGLHGMANRSTVMDGSRKVDDVEYPFFYNPMWGFFGDRTAGPPGTYYFRSGIISYDWNMFDQVLIRDAALPWFRDDIEIVTRIGQTELRKPNGRPDAEVGSDHFPIVFRLGPHE